MKPGSGQITAPSRCRRKLIAGLGPVVLAVLLAGGCANPPPAPVEERKFIARRPVVDVPVPAVYRVRKGDTLYGIAFQYGLDYREIAGWNGLQSADHIEVGQQLRLKPPARAKRSSRAGTAPEARRKSAEKKASPASPAHAPRKKAGESEGLHAELRWQWPTRGKLLAGFRSNDPGRNGLDIGGREGQAIRAAASGIVVYSGAGLIGYGELVIIKHNERLLSAYAHNRKRLVSERDVVKAGQPIAEMGRNDSNAVMLHFEIRVQGTPVDPLRFLPSR